MGEVITNYKGILGFFPNIRIKSEYCGNLTYIFVFKILQEQSRLQNLAHMVACRFPEINDERGFGSDGPGPVPNIQMKLS